MNLDFSDEQKAARDQIKRLLQDFPDLKSSRNSLKGREAFDQRLWAQLGREGWLGLRCAVQLVGSCW